MMFVDKLLSIDLANDPLEAFPQAVAVLGPLCAGGLGTGDSARCDVVLQALDHTLRWECSGVGFDLPMTDYIDPFAFCPRNNLRPVRAKSDLLDRADALFEHVDVLEVLGVEQHDETIGSEGEQFLVRAEGDTGDVAAEAVWGGARGAHIGSIERARPPRAYEAGMPAFLNVQDVLSW